jgi:hypothetical protein
MGGGKMGLVGVFLIIRRENEKISKPDSYSSRSYDLVIKRIDD